MSTCQEDGKVVHDAGTNAGLLLAGGCLLVHARAPSVEMTEADRQADVHGETVFAAVTSS